MRCPECRHPHTKVTATRLQDEGTVVRRRRRCLHCGYRFSTLENCCVADLVVLKRDGSRETFEPQKILSALKKTFKKDVRSDESIRQLHQRIVQTIRGQEKRPLTSQMIGDIVLEELRRIDPMAYIRFASVYKNFQTPHDFASAAQAISEES
ncbi:MAG: transcriptional regulator NrdR [Puniceicoccales bacterium]|jgi:transcriptional repressor NrdR|nr:transcriptional regulator NrdR [Puniceicoccales bacterium]